MKQWKLSNGTKPAYTSNWSIKKTLLLKAFLLRSVSNANRNERNCTNYTARVTQLPNDLHTLHTPVAPGIHHNKDWAKAELCFPLPLVELLRKSCGGGVGVFCDTYTPAMCQAWTKPHATLPCYVLFQWSREEEGKSLIKLSKQHWATEQCRGSSRG